MNDSAVSNTHALIFEVNGQRFIRDLGSRTGTLVNGKPVHHQLLEFGDEIRIGNEAFRFLPAAQAQAEQIEQEEFVEPALDEDEPIGIDFDAAPAEASASPVGKNGELEPIPLDPADEAPLRLLTPNESTDEVPAIDDDDLGLDFLAEEPTIPPIIPIEPLIGAEASTAIPIEPAESVAVPVEEVETPGEEQVLTAAPELADEPDTSVTPAPEAESVVSAAEAIEVMPVDLPVEPEAEGPPAREPEVREPESQSPEEIEPGPTAAEAPFAEEPHIADEAGVAETVIQELEERPGIAIEDEPVLQPAEPEARVEEVPPAVAEQVDLSSMRFEEPAVEEMAPETPEPSGAPRPLPDFVQESQGERPAPEATISQQAPGPAIGSPTPESVPASAPEIEVPGARGIAAVAEAIPAAGAAAAAAAVELAGPRLEVPLQSPKVKSRPRGPGGKFARRPRPESPLDEIPGVTKTGRKRGRKKNGSDLPAEPPQASTSEPVAEIATPPSEDFVTPGTSGEQAESKGETPGPFDAGTTPEASEPSSAVEPTATGVASEIAQIEPPQDQVETPISVEPISAAEAAAPTDPDLSPEWSSVIEESVQTVASIPLSAPEPENSQDALPVEDAPADKSLTASAEVLEPTDPTPESALDMESALDEVPLAEHTESPPVSLSDTAFGRDVEQFSGAETGPLVEEPASAGPPAQQPASFELTPAEKLPSNEPEAVAEHSESTVTEHSSSAPEAPRVELTEIPETEAEAEEFDFDLPDVDLEMDLSETAAERGVVGAAPEAPSVRAEARPPLDNSLSSTESLAPSRMPIAPPTLGTPAQALPAIGAAPLPPNVSVTPPPRDPFLGMSRDMDSFIGGMPLSLGQAAPPPPAPSNEPGSEVLAFPDEADPVAPLDLSVAEESLELFDENPEKLDNMPDKLDRVSDVEGTLVPKVGGAAAPSQGPPAAATPRPATPPPVSPPQAPRPATPMSQVAPPPPPRTAPLRSFTAVPPAQVPPVGFPGNISVTPPFGGVAPPQQRFTAPPIREVDVFSNTAFPPLDPTMFTVRKPSATPAPALARKQPAPLTEAELTSLARTPRPSAVLPNRQPARPAAAETSARRPWWKSLRILLPLMILAILVVILIVVFFPPRHTIQGSLQLQGLNRDNVGMVRQTTAALRALARNPRVRQLAEGTLRQQNLDPGLLEDPETISAMTEPVNSPFDDSRLQLQFRHATRHIEADKARMAALLAAVYAESGSSNDQAARIRQQASDAQTQLAEIQTQRDRQDALERKLSDQVTASAGSLAQALLINPRASLAQVSQDDRELRTRLVESAAQVGNKREALAAAQAKAAQSDTQAAAELRTLRQSIADLTSRLDAVRLAQTGQVDEAAAKFASTLDDFAHQLSAVPADSSDAKLAGYLTSARDAVDQVRQLNSQLTARAKQNSEEVGQLRRQIADRREAHLREVWAGDSSLQQLVEQRNAESHQYNAAVDSGYSEEAAKIKGVLEDLDKKIDARRGALATGGDADALQQSLQAAIDHTEADRQRDEREMMRQLSRLQPPTDLPAASKLSQQATSLITARQTYDSASALSATEADAEARRLQSQIAEQQARLDTLRQGSSNQAAVDAARAELDAAQAAEARASTAYATNHATFVALRELADARTAAADLADRVQQKQTETEELKQSLAALPVVLKPDDASVSVVYAPDTRVQYLVAGLVGVLLLFAGPLWMSFGGVASHDHLPQSMVESYDVPGPGTDEAFDDEHPATA
jgi:hypothetical protein